jgi:methyl-accepting chemotaxis protein
MVMIIILFVLTIFKAPDLAKSISELAGFPNLPANIISIKSTFDWVVTDIPTKEELEKQYTEALSWAVELKGKIVDWVQSTKDTVDDLRETMSWAEQKIEDIKDTYNDAKDFVDNASKKIEETKKIIEDTTKVINEVQNINNTSEFE